MNKAQKLMLPAILSLAALSLFACSSDEGGDKYDYCVSIEQQACLSGPFSSCEEGWLLSNSCQYESASFPSSSDKGGSSSSGGGSSSSAGGSASSFADKGNNIGNYKTMNIGSQTWMAENLNYKVAGSKCYGEGGEAYWDADDYVTLSDAEIQSNCSKYGRLYDWATAMALPSGCNSSVCAGQIQAKHQGICPAGWHLPTNAEWDVLYKHADSDYEVEARYDRGYSETAGKHLKAADGWNEDGNGADTYGFAALPGGYGNSDGYFLDAGNGGNWWSATENYVNFAYNRYMFYNNERAGWNDYSKPSLFSVRCLQD